MRYFYLLAVSILPFTANAQSIHPIPQTPATHATHVRWLSSAHPPVLHAAERYLTEVTARMWDGTDALGDYIRRITYAYDASGNQTESVRYTWDAEAQDWVGSSRRTSFYDASGNVTEGTSYTWNAELQDWTGSSRTTNTYDASGNAAEGISYTWDAEAQDWVRSLRSISTYNEDNNVIETRSYAWDAEAQDWSTSASVRTEHAYDTDGNRTEFASYTWNAEAQDWIGIIRVTKTYDNDGLDLSETQYTWDAEAQDWVRSFRHAWVYDASDNMTEWNTYFWDAAAQDWTGSGHMTYTYDTDGYITDVYGYRWDGEAADWQPDSHTFYTYSPAHVTHEETIPAGDPPPTDFPETGLVLDFADLSDETSVTVSRTAAPPDDLPDGLLPALDATWTIDAQGTASFTAEVCFSLDSLDASVNPGDLTLLKRADAASAWDDIEAVLRPDAADPAQLCAPAVTSFSDFAVVLRASGTPVERGEAPVAFVLHAAYPNPFNPTTTITFDLPAAGVASLVVYDVLGRQVEVLVAGRLAAGAHAVTWAAEGLSSGVYVCRLRAGDQVQTRMLMLVK